MLLPSSCLIKQNNNSGNDSYTYGPPPSEAISINVFDNFIKLRSFTLQNVVKAHPILITSGFKMA